MEKMSYDYGSDSQIENANSQWMYKEVLTLASNQEKNRKLK